MVLVIHGTGLKTDLKKKTWSDVFLTSNIKYDRKNPQRLNVEKFSTLTITPFLRKTEESDIFLFSQDFLKPSSKPVH